MKNIKNKIVISVLSAILLTGSIITVTAVAAANNNILPFKKAETAAPAEVKLDANKKVSAANTAPANASEYICVKPLDVVANPDKYLNKKVKFKASFDKFSTLGLDYKPAMRDSQKYISFLIKRDDVTDHTIPLSEMKIFILRSEAEKFIELDSGDIIEVYGKVFSDALTDAWIDTEKLVVVEKKNKDEKKKA